MGIIGTGRIAVDTHIPDCRKAGGELVALADAVPGRARKFAERFGTPHGWIRLRKHARGGAGIDGNSHVLDRLLFLPGSPTRGSVVARTYNEFAAQASPTPTRTL